MSAVGRLRRKFLHWHQPRAVPLSEPARALFSQPARARPGWRPNSDDRRNRDPARSAQSYERTRPQNQVARSAVHAAIRPSTTPPRASRRHHAARRNPSCETNASRLAEPRARGMHAAGRAHESRGEDASRLRLCHASLHRRQPRAVPLSEPARALFSQLVLARPGWRPNSNDCRNRDPACSAQSCEPRKIKRRGALCMLRFFQARHRRGQAGGTMLTQP